MLFIIQGTEKALNAGNMAAHLEKMTGETNDKFYDVAIVKLFEMEKIGQLEGFFIAGKVVIVIKVG